MMNQYANCTIICIIIIIPVFRLASFNQSPHQQDGDDDGPLNGFLNRPFQLEKENFTRASWSPKLQSFWQIQYMITVDGKSNSLNGGKSLYIALLIYFSRQTEKRQPLLSIKPRLIRNTWWWLLVSLRCLNCQFWCKFRLFKSLDIPGPAFEWWALAKTTD